MKKIITMILVVVSLGFAQANTGEKDGKTVELVQVSDNVQEATIFNGEGVLIEKGLMIDGKRDGVWQGFDANGNVTAEVTFKNGNKDGVWKIYENSELVYVLYYQNNSRLMAEDLASVVK